MPIHEHAHDLFLGLGSNEGPGRRILARAIVALADALALDDASSFAVSSLFASAPVGGPAGQREFLNAAMRLQTAFTPMEVLRKCQEVERQFGRSRSEHWGPRTLDIDILLYDDQRLVLPELVVPHPRLHERRFVLEPLVELAADRIHPVLGKTMGQIREGARSPADDEPWVRQIATADSKWFLIK